MGLLNEGLRMDTGVCETGAHSHTTRAHSHGGVLQDQEAYSWLKNMDACHCREYTPLEA